MKTVFRLISLLLLISITIWSCKKEWDSPEINTIPEGNILTLKQVKEYYTDTAGSYKFTEDFSVYATVTMDEGSGNLYKNVYVQDSTAALNIRLNFSGGLYQGDYVRIYLKGTTIAKFNDAFQLDSIDVDRNIIKQETQNEIAPWIVTMDSINNNLEKYEGYLIQLENVEFEFCGTGSTYADAINQEAMDATLKDCNGNNIIVRTSGFADFASKTIPTGGGSLVGAVGNFRGTPQVLIRSLEEVKMDGLRCSGNSGDCSKVNSISHDFTNIVNREDLCIECWENIMVQGSRVWEGGQFGSESYAEGSAHQTSDPENEMWLVSPTIEYAQTDKLNFDSQLAFTGFHDGLTVWISTNFNGSDVSTASWAQIDANVAVATSNSFSWLNSGNVFIADYVSTNFSGTYNIAFKYEGGANGGRTTTYRIDNVTLTQ